MTSGALTGGDRYHCAASISPAGNFLAVTALRPSLQQIVARYGFTSDCLLCIDMGDIACYAGGASTTVVNAVNTGQTFEFAGLAPPTFSGTAGGLSASECLTFNANSCLTYNQAGSDWTVLHAGSWSAIMVLQIAAIPAPPTTTVPALLGNDGRTGTTGGVAWPCGPSASMTSGVGPAALRAENGGGADSFVGGSATQIFTQGIWQFVAVTFAAPVAPSITATSTFYAGTASSVDHHAYSPATGTAPTYPLQIGGAGSASTAASHPLSSGSTLAMAAIFDRVLGSAEIGLLRAGIAPRYGY